MKYKIAGERYLLRDAKVFFGTTVYRDWESKTICYIWTLACSGIW